MAKVGRNERCPCGSGRKTKRCCGVERGPSREELAAAFISAAARRAGIALVGLAENEIAALLDEIVELPGRDLSLLVRLPDIITEARIRLTEAIEDEDAEAFHDALPRVLARVDTALARERLARAVLELRDSGRLDPRLAAVALIDLDCRSSHLMHASTVHSALVTSGAMKTPMGLVLAG